MIRQRVRIRFRKEGDLRLIGHRDLVRTFERWFRRAGLRLSMSQGYHPKARMSFPSALALGIAGAQEVMEFELAEVVDAEHLRARLLGQAPDGLTVCDVRVLRPGEGKARATGGAYSIPVPESERERLEKRLVEFNENPSYWMGQVRGGAPADGAAGLEDLRFDRGVLRFQLNWDCPHCVRPREVLKALGLERLETQGHFLTRTAVELAP